MQRNVLFDEKQHVLAGFNIRAAKVRLFWHIGARKKVKSGHFTDFLSLGTYFDMTENCITTKDPADNTSSGG